MRLTAVLSERDQAILEDVARVRVLTGRQLQRLHFPELIGNHRDRTRRRVLERLVSLNLLTTLDRRIGGIQAGSAGLIYCLAAGGQRWWTAQCDAYQSRFRAPRPPTERFMIHNLVVSELYVGLKEAERNRHLQLQDFLAEPARWWSNSDGEWIKPDAYAIVSRGEVEDYWAIEVDNATESLLTVRSKLKAYLDLAKREERGPSGGPLPRVLVTVPDGRRLQAVARLLRTLPEPAAELFVLTTHEEAVAWILKVLWQ